MKVNGLEISELSLMKTAELINGKRSGGLTIYCCSMNDVAAADEDKDFKKRLKRGSLLTPDGMPLVWWMRRHGVKAERVYGPDLMSLIMPKFVNKQIFLGDKKNQKYFEKYGKYLVLPFKDEFDEKDYSEIVNKIRKNRTKLIWIGLGSKKQVIMADELRRLLPDRIYITVGAAFDFLSGNKKQAPVWIRKSGGEWLYRWWCEPERLTGRYLKIGRFLIRKLVQSCRRNFSENQQ